jgi:methionine-rich copper-binding protein CopC
MRFYASNLSFLALLSLQLLATGASAHAILVHSTPKAHQVVTSGELAVVLEFNSRIDATRSNLTLVLPGGKVEILALLPQPSASSLSAKTPPLAAGSHIIRWQVLANDGHITRGEVPFDVK